MDSRAEPAHHPLRGRLCPHGSGPQATSGHVPQHPRRPAHTVAPTSPSHAVVREVVENRSVRALIRSQAVGVRVERGIAPVVRAAGAPDPVRPGRTTVLLVRRLRFVHGLLEISVPGSGRSPIDVHLPDRRAIRVEPGETGRLPLPDRHRSLGGPGRSVTSPCCTAGQGRPGRWFVPMAWDGHAPGSLCAPRQRGTAHRNRLMSERHPLRAARLQHVLALDDLHPLAALRLAQRLLGGIQAVPALPGGEADAVLGEERVHCLRSG